jgi:hypothetical protein
VQRRCDFSTQRHIFCWLILLDRSLLLYHSAWNAHLPNDLDGFLSLLIFQTGHKPATRSGAYALENGLPSKLQPDLIHRYLGNSDIWQKFFMISKDNYLECGPSSTLVGDRSDLLRRSQVSPKAAARVEKLTCDPPLSEIHDGSRQARSRVGCKCKLEHHVGPTAKKIHALVQELDRLVAERNSRSTI